MKHFIFYISDLSGGGAESVFVRVANEMVLRNNSVTIIVDSVSGELLPLVNPEVQIFPLNTTSIVRKILSITHILISIRYDRFYTTLNQPNLLGFVSSCIVGKRKKHFGRVAALHSMSIIHTKSYKRKLLLYLLSLSYRWFGNVVSVSEAVSLDLLKNYKVKRAKIKKIYNPIKPIRNLKSPVFRKANKSTYSILVVGRLVKQKNVDQIIRSFRQFTQIYNRVKLNILGDGPELQALQTLTEQYGLTEKVRFRGFVDDPSVFYKKSDLFILFSSWEGLPNVVLDALTFDLQIIVSDAPGGSRELVNNGKFGFICPVEDINALTDTMHMAKNHPLKICETEKREFLQKFNLGAITSLYEGQHT